MSFVPHSTTGYLKNEIFKVFKFHANVSSADDCIEIMWLNGPSAHDMETLIKSLEIPEKFKDGLKPIVYINHRPAERGFVDPDSIIPAEA